MNTLRLSTLSLSLAIAVMTLGYANPSFADKPDINDCEEPAAGHCHDDDGNGETSAVYTAKLTMGGFIFRDMNDNSAIAVTVTPNKRGNSYHSKVALDMSRPPDIPPDDPTDDQMAWDIVFGSCANLLTTNPPLGVAVADNWTIDNSGGNKAGTVGSDIRIRFKDVEAEGSDVDINFDLIGVLDDPFLPVGNDTSSFTLTQFVIFGDKKRGESCRSGVQYLKVEDMQVYSVLEITRTQ
ncbi:MAG: hypothetical protein IIB68_03315 [Proteobacteria bacterium]|nr:hypothetical protein [Pseudomonadota bacterium]